MSQRQYYYGFDYLRAVLPFFVIAIHTKIFSTYGSLYQGGQQPNFFDVIQFNLFYLAVPVFLIISLFLSFQRTSRFREELRRSYQLILLYIFWVALWMLYSGSRPSFSIMGLLIFMMTGGQSIFYFLFSLACLSLMAIAVRQLPVQWIWMLLAISLCLQGLWPLLNIYSSEYRYLVAHWNPLLFLPCLFVARLISDYKELISQKPIIPISLLILFVLVALIEWTSLIHPNHGVILATIFPSYARISPILGAASIVMIALVVKTKPNRFVLLLSSSSLGLYCLHPFLESSVGKITAGHGVGVFFLLTSILSLIGTVALKHLLRARLI